MAKTTIDLQISYTLPAMVNLPEGKEVKDIKSVERSGDYSVDVEFRDGTVYHFDEALCDGDEEFVDGFTTHDHYNEWENLCFTDGVLKTPMEV